MGWGHDINRECIQDGLGMVLLLPCNLSNLGMSSKCAFVFEVVTDPTL